MEDNSVSVEFVRIKVEPMWEQDGEQSPLIPVDQIKVEVELGEVKAVRVKEEPSSGSLVVGPLEHIVVTPALPGSSVDVKQEAEDPESVALAPPPTAAGQSQTMVYLQTTPTNQSQATNTYICDTCGNTYHQRYHLILHIQRNACSLSVQKPFACEICNNKFASRSSLNQHKHTHSSVKLYSCQMCDKQFTVLNYLKAHERRHLGDKPYSCEICQKAFSKLSDVQNHKRIHTGDKPYSCEQCDKKFGHLSDLNKHKRTHTGERPYSCDICNKKFKISTHLNAHKRIHGGKKPFSCDTCKKQFYDEASLNMHTRVHTGEKPFSCDICEKVFTRNSSLITHRRTHTHVFFCGLCNQNFKQLANLKKHNKRHTREATSKKKKSKTKRAPDVIKIHDVLQSSNF